MMSMNVLYFFFRAESICSASRGLPGGLKTKNVCSTNLFWLNQKHSEKTILDNQEVEKPSLENWRSTSYFWICMTSLSSAQLTFAKHVIQECIFSNVSNLIPSDRSPQNCFGDLLCTYTCIHIDTYMRTSQNRRCAGVPQSPCLLVCKTRLWGTLILTYAYKCT